MLEALAGSGARLNMPQIYGINYKDPYKDEQLKLQQQAQADARKAANDSLLWQQEQWKADQKNKAQTLDLVKQLTGTGGALGSTLTGVGGGGTGSTIPVAGGVGTLPGYGSSAGGAGTGSGGTGTGYEERLYSQPFQNQWGQQQLTAAPQVANAYAPQGTGQFAGHQRMLANLLTTQNANNQRVNDMRQMGKENLQYAGTQRALQQQDLENQRGVYQNQLSNQTDKASILLKLLGS